MATTTVPTIQSAIIASISTQPRTHADIYRAVRDRVVFNGIQPKPSNVRARTAELCHAGLVRQRGTNARGHKLWSVA